MTNDIKKTIIDNANKGEQTMSLIDTVQSGDKVTIINQHGIKLIGRAVMKARGINGWILNVGGKYGTPSIASDENIIKVRKSSN